MYNTHTMRSTSGPECLTTLNPCQNCIYVPETMSGEASSRPTPEEIAAKCGVLIMSRELDVTKQANQSLELQTQKMALDRVTGLLSDVGLETLIETDEAIQDMLLHGDWGVTWIDVRGLKFVNDSANEKTGDALLNLMAEQMSTELTSNTRTQKSGPLRKNEQRVHPDDTDIKSRFTGDEFLVLFKNISAPELAAVTDGRLAPLFSVGHAITSQNTPVIASLSHAHSSEINNHDGTPLGAFRTVLALAQQRHHGEDGHSGYKKAQYDEMWQKLNSLSTDERASHKLPQERPSDDRMIVDFFYKIFRPDYLAQLSELEGQTKD